MERLREARKKKHLTMKQLGAMVGVTEAAISHYELGKRQPDYDLAAKLSECLDVTVDYLLGRDDPVQIEKASADDPLTEQIMAKARLMSEEELRQLLRIMDAVKK